MEMDMAMMMCPDCHEVKMGPKEMESKIMKCDGCGGMMHELELKHTH